MKHHTTTHRSLSVAFPAILVAATSLLASLSAQAATITLLNNDVASNNSFVNSGQWSNAAVPTAGNDYVVTGKQLIGAGAIAPLSDYTGTSTTTFAGDSLTLTNNGTTRGLLLLRWRGEVNVPNLIVNNAEIQNFITDGTINTCVLGGNMTIVEAGVAYIRPSVGTNRYITVNSNISGTGILHMFQGSVTVGHAGNTYSGGTLIGGAVSDLYKAYATVNQDGALGTGNVSLFNTYSKLTLTGGTTNNYIADTASFLLQDGVTAGAITLNFTGTDSIAALSFDLGTTWAATGTWGAIGSGAAHESALFAGTGLLNVVPEPSTWLLLGMSATVLVIFRRRRLS